MGSMETFEEMVETLNDQQEKLKTRLGNLRKLVSILSAAVCKHKHVLENCDENLLKKIASTDLKVTPIF